jgi:hypothetical protein
MILNLPLKGGGRSPKATRWGFLFPRPRVRAESQDPHLARFARLTSPFQGEVKRIGLTVALLLSVPAAPACFALRPTKPLRFDTNSKNV